MPGGYTIGLMSVSSHAIAPTLYKTLPFNADKDFAPVTMLWPLPNLPIVRKTPGPRTVPELITMAMIDVLHVPYRGSALAVQDFLAGQVDMIFDNIPGLLAQRTGGKVNGLAVTSLERSPMAPGVPAMTEFLPGCLSRWPTR